ncbi:MAG: SprB repeat-containing protein, partial [Bacteroidota bacterium]|nr:SprB repeat-containing protein [Bacteroidota bacterium]
TGNGSCPAAYDTIKINYVGFAGTVTLTSTPVSCFGGTNGTATVGITGGTPPYTYSWNTSPAQSTITAVNLAIGTYSVTITNGIGCTSTNPVTITQPPPVQLASSITHIACSGQSSGSISITPTGGIAPYTYLWQPGNQTTSSISSQPVGTYTITVSDSNSCQLTTPYTINQSAPIVISLTPTDVSCFNGNDGIASSTVSGGNAPYTYNWSSGASSPNATGLQAGTFSLTITDNLGCLLSNSVSIGQPTAVITSTTSTDETCNYLNNGTATAVASGGTPGYTYLWQPGALTTMNINNLSSGTYTLTSTDLKGCTAIAFATVAEPALLAINFISQINVSCFAGTDGTVTASPVGGTPNYTYLWSNGATTAQISNLSSQSFTTTVTDSKGCVTTNTATITQPTLLTTSTTITNETCSYSNNGTSTS